ncbi:Ribosomal silencing factor RsfS [Crateriforma conspicua]|nr:Ribosomal silencing factor RsfS [Crateriforma conspicua]
MTTGNDPGIVDPPFIRIEAVFVTESETPSNDGPDSTPQTDASGDGDMGQQKSKPVSANQWMTTDSWAIRPLGLDGSRKLARAAMKVALENKADDALVLDVSGQSAEFDFFVVATGTSRRQLHAISEQIDDVLQKDLGDLRMGIEGYQESSWIVLDYGNVVIHLFDEDTRQYYDLESLWADAKCLRCEDLDLRPDGTEMTPPSE